MDSIVIASSNRRKLDEIAAILRGHIPHLRPQGEFGLRTPPETGNCFSENAIAKARHACNRTGLAAIGEDSGLEVDLLNGEPGIRSARYAGEHASDSDNLELLLKRIRHFPAQQLTARFRCAITYIDRNTSADRQPLLVETTWEGRLLKSPRGKNGFGYDPIFFIPEYGCTAAELAPATKNETSHRALALFILRDRLVGLANA